MVLAQKWWVPPLRKVIADLQRGAPMRSQTSSAGRRDDARPWKSKVRRGAGSDLLVAGGNKLGKGVEASRAPRWTTATKRRQRPGASPPRRRVLCFTSAGPRWR
jgi:hypothetical protein